MRALTPGGRPLVPQVSPRPAPARPLVPAPTAQCPPVIAFAATPAGPGRCRRRPFGASSSRPPAASRSSSSRPSVRFRVLPPHLTVTPFPAATEMGLAPTRTCTVLIRHPWGRTTKPLCGRNPYLPSSLPRIERLWLSRVLSSTILLRVRDHRVEAGVLHATAARQDRVAARKSSC